MAVTAVHEVPVLVIGAGPAGLTTAITLARSGVRCLLVERRPALSTLPRATAVSTRTMEIVRSWGLEPRVRAGGVEVEWDAWVTETLSSDQGVSMPLGFPTREEAARVSPTQPACIPQDHLEPVLLDHLRSLPSADVRLGMELSALEQDSDGVVASLREPRTGRVTLVRASFLVAADGAHSTVRGALGIPMEGPDDLIEHSTVQFRAPLWAVLGVRRHGLYVITHPDAPGIFVPLGTGDRWLYGQELAPGQRRLTGPDDPRIVRLLRATTGARDLTPRVERVGHFSFAAQIASRYREQRAFLVGDAAHRVTPRGGTGMNTAVHDGYDLAWKLAWVVRGWAAPALLDSYEAERRPVGLHNTSRSADPEGSRRDAADGLAVDLGGRIPHAWLVGSRRTSTLDLVGAGVTLLTDAAGSTWRRAVASGVPPLEVRTVDNAAANVLGIRGGGAVLVRPDARPVATWSAAVADPAGTVRAAVAMLTGSSGAPGLPEPQRLAG
jgi:putative polyketide hydroxylase